MPFPANIELSTLDGVVRRRVWLMTRFQTSPTPSGSSEKGQNRT